MTRTSAAGSLSEPGLAPCPGDVPPSSREEMSFTVMVRDPCLVGGARNPSAINNGGAFRIVKQGSPPFTS
jgi:hypothetical protein